MGRQVWCEINMRLPSTQSAAAHEGQKDVALDVARRQGFRGAGDPVGQKTLMEVHGDWVVEGVGVLLRDIGGMRQREDSCRRPFQGPSSHVLSHFDFDAFSSGVSP